MYQNLWKLGRETGKNPTELLGPSQKLRQELEEKGLKGFKRGGRVKKTGPAKLHKGERVLTAKTAKKVTPAKIRAVTRKTAPRRRSLR